MKLEQIVSLLLILLVIVSLVIWEVRIEHKFYHWFALSKHQKLQDIFDYLVSPQENSKCPTQPIAKAKAHGRLGNQIATYANHIALQWQYGYQLWLAGDISASMNRLFSNVTFPNISSIEARCNISYLERATDWVQWRQFLERKNASCKNNGTVHTFVQSCVWEHGDVMHLNIKNNHFKPDWDILDSQISLIQKYHLDIKQDLKIHTNMILKNNHSQLNTTFVGVHVRRGDFGGYKRFGHKMIDEAYYLAGMEYYRHKYAGGCSFIIASDDMEWCRQKFSAQDVFHIGGTSPEHDLALLAACNHSLVGYGSYGLWGGLFAGGEVLVPRSILLYKGTSSETTARVLGWTTLEGF